MSENNYNQNCAFSEQTVSYLYDEIAGREKTVFEAHLKNCSVCAEEIAGFGSVRSSVFQWKAEEFELLNTPKIEFLHGQAGKINKSFVSGITVKSWFAGLRRTFAPSPIWAPSLAFLLVLGGLFLFVQNFTKENQVASNAGKDTRQINNSPEITKRETSNIAENALPDLNQNSVESLPESIDSTDGNLIVKEKINGKKQPAALKVSNNLSKAQRNSQPPAPLKIKSDSYRKIDETNAIAARLNLNVGRKIPKLNNIEEDEEEATLRLTDLLDEVGGK